MVHLLTRRGESESEVAAAVAAEATARTAAIAAAVPPRPTWTNDVYQDVMGTAMGAVASTNTALVANRLYAVLGYGDVAHTLDKIALLVTTFAAASSFRFGVYAPLASTGRPGTLIGETGVVDAGSNGFKAGDSTAVVPAGYWWAAVVSDGTGTVAHVNPTLGPLGGDGSSNYGHVYMAHTFGALPATFSAIPSVGTIAPRLWVRS